MRHCSQFRVILPLFTLVWTIFMPQHVCALATQDKLTQYGRQTWQTENGLPQNTVRAILQDHEGYIWIGTESGLVRFDGLKFVVFDIKNTGALKSNSITSLLEDTAGTLWIGTMEGVTSLHGNKFQTYTTEDGLPTNYILSLFSDHTGVISAVTTDGVAQFHLNHFIRNAADSKQRAGTAMTVQDRYGCTWTGTEQGLTASSRGVTKVYTTKNGLPSNRITVLYLDQEGSLWIGTDSGAVRIVNRTIEKFPSGDPLSRDAVLSIYEDREGNMWLGTDTSGLRRCPRRVRPLGFCARE
jgi:ligand-binding sensor domain-containing protein